MFSSGGPSVRFLTRYDGEVSVEEIEELLSEGTKAAGLYEGYENRERNKIRNLKRYADKVAARLDTLIDAAKEREALNNK